MCEWSLACCGCIVATTADCQNRRSLFFNNKCASARYMMQAWFEGMDDSA